MVMPAWRRASPAAISASRLKPVHRDQPLAVDAVVGKLLDLGADAVLQVVDRRDGRFRRSPERPARIAFQMSGAVLPSAQMPPMPVTAIRWRAMSGVFLGDEDADGLDHVADVLEIAPGLDRVHLDLDAVGFLEVEDDLGQFQRMDAQGGKLGVQPDLAGVRLGMSLDLGNDVFSESDQPSRPSRTMRCPRGMTPNVSSPPKYAGKSAFGIPDGCREEAPL